MALRIIVSGGGTGGHVFPALEVARCARDAGHEVRYFGSRRGQEADACARVGLRCETFDSGPVVKLASIGGMRSLVKLLVASKDARRAMIDYRPDVVLGTGGYSSAPVTYAARKLKVAVVIHEQNSVPGRTQLIAARTAAAVCTVFETSAVHFRREVIRTGMPVRPQFRTRNDARLQQVFVTGGSQGSQFINNVTLQCVRSGKLSGTSWVHVVGKANLQDDLAPVSGGNYQRFGFLQAEDMATKLGSSSVAVCRSGAGTLAELAALRIPSVLVPYDLAYGDHQRLNAEQFTADGAATVISQSDLNEGSLTGALAYWLNSQDERVRAVEALERWDVPDATEQILGIVEKCAQSSK